MQQERPMTESTPPANQASADFVFGTLATDELRLAHMRAARAGMAHDHQLAPPDPRPGEPATVHVTLGPRIAADRVTCYYSIDGSDPRGRRGVAANGTAIELERTGVAWDTLLWGYVEEWAGVITPQPAGTLVRYRIEAWSERSAVSHWASEIAGVTHGERPENLHPDDAQRFATPGLPPRWPIRRTGSYAYHVDEERVPDWLRDAVIYHIFIDRFDPGGGRPFAMPTTLGGFFGGTLRGVIERLDYIDALGANCLWLSPLFPSPSHHGYDATDYRRVEPRLGSDADLRELIAAAHTRSIRVLLDYVVNHVSHEHAAFQRARADRNSPEASWFTFTRWPNEYLSFFGVHELPQIDSDALLAQVYMIEHAGYWLEQGIDGFRLDYANGPSHAFWSTFRAATRAIKHDSITLGEVVETAALQRTYQGRMDGCLDFLLLQALRQFFAFGELSALDFDAFLSRHLAFFPTDFALPSFLDNHDMNRFLWVAGGDARRLKLAALCQFTLPHPPIIYYGTEAGLSQARDVRYKDGSGHPEESRLPMLWGSAQNHELHDFYRQLIALRRGTPGLWRSTRRTLAADDRSGLYVYGCTDGADEAIVALNNGGGEQRFVLPAGQPYQLILASDEAIMHDGDAVALAPFSGAVLLQSPPQPLP
jgi:cyclomaltodextrinase / maltogenic alpha-amylase / neopullulanase